MDLFMQIFSFILDTFKYAVSSGFYSVLGLFLIISLTAHLLISIFKRV